MNNWAGFAVANYFIKHYKKDMNGINTIVQQFR
jgi:hypothetical protein